MPTWHYPNLESCSRPQVLNTGRLFVVTITPYDSDHGDEARPKRPDYSIHYTARFVVDILGELLARSIDPG